MMNGEIMKPFGKRLILVGLLFSALACKLVSGAPLVTPRADPTSLPQQQAVQATLTAILSSQPAAAQTQGADATAAPYLPASGPNPGVTLAPTSPPIPSPTLPPTQPAAPNPADIQTQQQVFDELWETVDEHYLYPDFNGLDMQAVRQEYNQRIQAGMTMTDFYLAMHQFVDSLGDDHSTYFDPEEAKAEDAEYAGTYDYVGIGVLTVLAEQKQALSVLLVFPGSPAEQAGIRAHDALLSVDGQPLVDAGGTRQSLLRGQEGTTIQVEAQTPGQAPRVLSITRQRVNSALPVPYNVLTSPGGKRIGYIFIPTFNDSTVGDTIGKNLRAMTQDGPLDGLILDNRENGGGSSTVLEQTLGYFVKGKVGYFVEQRNRTSFEARGNDVNGSRRVPLVVMVGKGTASFGEVFAGIMKDLGRAYLIGETTDGNVEILSIFNFSDGSRAWIAASSFRPLNNPNQDWEQTGIIPDQTVPSNWEEVTLETDPAVLAALQHFDAAP